MRAQRSECYCAFCKNKRKVYNDKHLSLMAIIMMVLLSYVIAQILWQSPDPRGLVILSFLLFLGEGFSRVRWRKSLICPYCAFDPLIYKKDPAVAGEKIKQFLEMRKERPEYLLKPQVRTPQMKARSEFKGRTSQNSSLQDSRLSQNSQLQQNAISRHKGRHLNLKTPEFL